MSAPAEAAEASRPVKVMIVTLFGPEAAPWRQRLRFDSTYAVAVYKAAWPLASDIVARWPEWRDGVPAR